MFKTEPQESIAQQLTFDWSPFRISSALSKVRNTLLRIISSFHLNGHIFEFRQ